MSIKIGFIFPSSSYLHDPFRGDPHTHFQILTVLEWFFGDEVSLMLIDLRGIKLEFAKYHLDKCDIYLHSVYTLDYEEQKSIVSFLRQRYPKSVHIAGGPHAITFQGESLKIFDSLIIGDGEECIIQAMKDYLNNDLKKIYKQENPLDINKYPHPRRHFLSESANARPGLMTTKSKPEYRDLMSTTVIFSRGCPYNCYFCAMPEIKKFTPGIRYRKPILIEEEIEYLKEEYGIQGISLLDEISIPLTMKDAIPHLEAIGRTNIKWRAQCRVDGINKELARLARQAGCITMAMGVESVSQQCLDIINKKIKIDMVKKSIKFLQDEGIECRIYMIIGLPGEPEDIVEQTWRFIQETNPASVYLSIFTVRPGTEVYRNPKKFGIKKITTDWNKTMHMYSRYDSEMSDLTFEYNEVTPDWRGGWLADAVETTKKLIRRLRIPFSETWNMIDFCENNHEFYGGRVGTFGGDGRNFAIQNSDLLIAIGSRISDRITGGMIHTFICKGGKKGDSGHRQ